MKLDLLGRIAALFQKRDINVAELLQDMTLLLPAAWQYPEIAGARIVYGDIEVSTPNFSCTPWMQTAGFRSDNKAGVIDIAYLEEKPLKFEGPFSSEERHFIDHIAEILRIYLDFREAREALAVSEKNLVLLKNTIPAILYTGYDDWSVDLYDDKIQEITGYQREKFDSRQMKWSDIVFKDDLENARAIFIQALKGSKAYVREYRVKHNNGGIKWIQERAYIVCNDLGRIDYVCGIFFDISDRRLVEEELDKYREHLEELVEKRTYELITANQQLQLDVAEREKTQREREKLIIELQHAMDQLRTMAVTDELTKLFNRRHFFAMLTTEIDRSIRYGHYLGCIMIDIDHFKKINDSYGHQTGDLVLQTLAKIIRVTCRNCDTAARYGGEELAVLLPETDLKGSCVAAERIREASEQHIFRSGKGDEFKVTLSIGVASFSHDELKMMNNYDLVISSADTALYKAKKGGRNRVGYYMP